MSAGSEQPVLSDITRNVIPGFRKQGANSTQAILPVFVALEYGATVDPTDHYVVQSTGSI
jgi:hypothetical protein